MSNLQQTLLTLTEHTPAKLCYGKEWMVMKWREGKTLLVLLPGKPSVKLILIIIILDEGS